MAEAVFTTTKRTLECSICFRTYNLQDRIPKNLKCGHSFCESCVKNLNQNSVIKCPKDRTDSKINDLVTCFAVTDILDTLCEDCSSQEKSVKCYHCDKTLCEKCLGNHAPAYHSDLMSELNELDKHIFNALDNPNNTSFSEIQYQKAKDAIEQIHQSIKVRRDALDQLEKDLEQKVKQFEKHNTEQCMKWENDTEDKVKEAKTFCQQSKDNLGTTYTLGCSMEFMYGIHNENKSILEGILDSRDKEPLVIGYTFMQNTDVTKVRPGEIVLSGPPEAVALYKIPQTSGQSADIYRTARFKSMTGSQGSGPGEFDMPRYVTSMDDRIIITDNGNHRLNIYDHNLHLLYLHGNKGHNPYQFHDPEGVTVNAEQDILVCDALNKRIITLTKYCGRKRAQFTHTPQCHRVNHSMGLCIDKNGTLYVCDQTDHQVKVIDKNGTLLRCIGSKGKAVGQFGGYPLDVTLHKDTLLISDNTGSTIKIYSTSGTYIKSVPEEVSEEYSKNRHGPTGIAVDKYNNIIYADFAGYLVVLNQEGEFVCTIGSPGDKAGEFKDPWGVNITPQGDIVVCDTGNHRVQIFEV